MEMKQMRTIGMRASNKQIYCCVCEVDETGISILNLEKIIIPQALRLPDRLGFIRNTLFSIFLEYNIESAWLRLAEMQSNNNIQYIERLNIEGVIQELISNCGIKYYGAGRKSTIASKLNEKVQDIGQYIEGKQVYNQIPIWDKLKKEEREAILSSLVATRLVYDI